MIKRVKYALLLLLVLFLILNVLTIIIFKDGIARDFLKIDANWYFDSLDATMLLNYTNTIFMPYEPTLQRGILLLRLLSIIIGSLISVYLLYKERKLKNIAYLCATSFAVFISFIDLGIVKPGIYDFLRKVSTSYILGLISTPWIFYYLVVLIPIILIVVILSLELWTKTIVKWMNRKSIFTL